MHLLAACGSRFLARQLAAVGAGGRALASAAVGGLVLAALLLGAAPLARGAPSLTARLEATPPFPALRAAAQARNIPLEGFDPPAATHTLAPGDAVTTLVTLRDGKGHLTQWLIYFQAATPTNHVPTKPEPSTVMHTSTGKRFEFAPSPAVLVVRTLGPFADPASGRTASALRDKSARITVNQAFLGLGLEQGTAAIYRLSTLRHQNHAARDSHFSVGSSPFKPAEVARGREMAGILRITTEEERALAGGVPALLSYFDTIQQTPGLETIMRRVLSLPSPWALMKSLVKTGHIAAGISIGFPEDRLGPLSLPAWGLAAGSPLYALPAEVDICDHHALTLTMVVTTPRPPLLTCGGIVGFLAENPDTPGNYLTLRVISARCPAAHRGLGSTP